MLSRFLFGVHRQHLAPTLFPTFPTRMQISNVGMRTRQTSNTFVPRKRTQLDSMTARLGDLVVWLRYLLASNTASSHSRVALRLQTHALVLRGSPDRKHNVPDLAAVIATSERSSLSLLRLALFPLPPPPLDLHENRHQYPPRPQTHTRSPFPSTDHS